MNKMEEGMMLKMAVFANAALRADRRACAKWLDTKKRLQWGESWAYVVNATEKAALERGDAPWEKK